MSINACFLNGRECVGVQPLLISLVAFPNVQPQASEGVRWSVCTPPRTLTWINLYHVLLDHAERGEKVGQRANGRSI